VQRSDVLPGSWHSQDIAASAVLLRRTLGAVLSGARGCRRGSPVPGTGKDIAGAAPRPAVTLGGDVLDVAWHLERTGQAQQRANRAPRTTVPARRPGRGSGTGRCSVAEIKIQVPGNLRDTATQR